MIFNLITADGVAHQIRGIDLFHAIRTEQFNSPVVQISVIPEPGDLGIASILERLVVAEEHIIEFLTQARARGWNV